MTLYSIVLKFRLVTDSVSWFLADEKVMSSTSARQEEAGPSRPVQRTSIPNPPFIILQAARQSTRPAPLTPGIVPPVSSWWLWSVSILLQACEAGKRNRPRLTLTYRMPSCACVRWMYLPLYIASCKISLSPLRFFGWLPHTRSKTRWSQPIAWHAPLGMNVSVRWASLFVLKFILCTVIAWHNFYIFVYSSSKLDTNFFVDSQCRILTATALYLVHLL